MSVASNIPGTLQGYDLVLSLSAEALNAQFLELYNKPIPSGKLPLKGLQLKGLEPLPVSQHYINHELKIFPNRESVKLAEGEEVEGGTEKELPTDGIHGFIECPQLSFSKEEANIAVMTLKFKTQMVGGEEQKSYLRYNKGGNMIKTNISGWTMSWEVEIRSQGVENFMQDLIEASKSPEEYTLMTDEACKQLEDRFKTLDPSKFMASTVFCLFEDARITRSFKLSTAAGSPPSVQEQTTICMAIGSYFARIRDHFGHLPTAETPYVLGYGISQKPAALAEVNPDAKSDSTPPYFIPRRFDISVTPSRAKEDRWYTAGTVNFCMQTYRAKESEQIKILASDKNAGSFEETFFKITSTRGSADGDNGIMSFSKNIFNDYWIRSLLDLVDFDPTKIPCLLCMDGKIYDPGLAENDKTYRNLEDGHGNFTMSIRYSSDLERYDQVQRQKSELLRRSFIDIEFKSGLDLYHETKGLNAFADWLHFISWRLGRTARVISRYKLGFKLVPGAGGTFLVVEDPSRTNFPKDASSISPVVRELKGNTNTWEQDVSSSEYGTYIYVQNHNSFSWFGYHDEMEKFKKTAYATNGRDFDLIDDKLQKIFGELKTSVVLPAGNVFTFKGINTDKDGNLHTSVNYRTVSKAKIVKQR